MRVEGLGLRVQGLGLRVQGLGFRVYPCTGLDSPDGGARSDSAAPRVEG